MRWKVRNLEYLVEIFSSKNGVVFGTGARRNRHIWVDQSHCRETVQVRALSYSCSDAFCTQSCAGSFAETVSSIRTARTSTVRSPVAGYVPGWDDYSWSINKIMLFIYANIFILWQHFVSWHIRLVHKRQFCSQDKILNERLRKLNFQGKSYPCWRIYWAHKQACIGFQVLQSSFSKHIAHAFTLYLFVIVELYSMPSMVLCWCNAKDRACKSGGPHQGNPLGITN